MLRIKNTKATASLSLICLMLLPAAAFSQEMHTIKGSVVDKNNKGIADLPIIIKRGAEILAAVNTKKDGTYAIDFAHGDTIEAIIYGNSEYLPNTVFSISGAYDHNITKVLRKNQKGAKLSRAEAWEVLTTLDYFRINSSFFAEQMIQYSGVVEADSIPEDLRPRLQEFEGAVAILLKENQKKDFIAKDAQGTVEATVKGYNISIIYNRLSLSGRDPISTAHVGYTWRKDPFTVQAKLTGDFLAGGTIIRAGHYSLTIKKGAEDKWILYFIPMARAWDQNAHIALPLDVKKADDLVERLTINLGQQRDKAVLNIQWGNTVLTGLLVAR